MGKRKLKWRVFAFMLGFCTLLLIILWLFQTVFLTDMYKWIRKQDIQKAIADVELNINDPTLQTVLRQLEYEKEIMVMPTQDFAPPPREEPDNRDRRPFETITQTNEFTLNDGQTISLTFYAMITPVDATVSTLRTQLYIITGIMVLLSIAIAIMIAKRISKPIEEINKSAKVLASGHYDTHFNGRGFLEIKELSDTLNIAAAELSKVESLRRELMANISHDLRTPLALIYSYAEMMHDFPDEITPEQTQIIMDETKRLTTLVNDVLDVSRLEMGTMHLNLSTFNLTESISVTIDRMAALLQKDGYSLSFLHENNVYVNADEVKITQALYNLLINAIHYCGKNKTIIVRQMVLDHYTRIEVSDDGDGIDPSELPYIWDRYYRIDKKHKRNITGTGLGLSIVKRIIDLHGGTYGVETELGKGCTFWFVLKR